MIRRLFVLGTTLFCLLLLFGTQTVRAQQKPLNLEAHELYFAAITSGVNGTETPALASYLNAAGVAEPEHKAAVQALTILHAHDTAILGRREEEPQCGS